MAFDWKICKGSFVQLLQHSAKFACLLATETYTLRAKKLDLPNPAGPSCGMRVRDDDGAEDPLHLATCSSIACGNTKALGSKYTRDICHELGTNLLCSLNSHLFPFAVYGGVEEPRISPPMGSCTFAHLRRPATDL